MLELARLQAMDKLTIIDESKKDEAPNAAVRGTWIIPDGSV
jgi:hypothetical protein